MKLGNLKAQLTPKRQLVTVVAAAVAVLCGALYMTVGNEKERISAYRPDKDKKVSVLTDSNNSQIGIENVSGQLKYAEGRIRVLQEKVQKLENDRDAKSSDALREQAWREKFDALTSEIQRLQARIDTGDVGRGPSSDANIDPEILAAREMQRRNDPNSGSTGSTEPRRLNSLFDDDNTSAGQTEFISEDIFDQSAIPTGKGRSGKLSISVVQEPEQPKKKVRQKKGNKNAFYIPAGSILTGTIITGADYPTGKGSFENPTPALIRISKQAILPNRFSSDLRECFLLASGHGVLSTERAQLRSETLACVRKDGQVIERRISAYVSGEDGKAGVKGRLVSKQGQLIARTMVAGFLSGLSQAFDYSPVSVLNTNPSGTIEYQKNFSSEAAQSGVVTGATKALDRVADFYMKLADEMTPAIEINAGRQVDIVVTTGTELLVEDKYIGKTNEGSNNSI